MSRLEIIKNSIKISEFNKVKKQNDVFLINTKKEFNALCKNFINNINTSTLRAYSEYVNGNVIVLLIDENTGKCLKNIVLSKAFMSSLKEKTQTKTNVLLFKNTVNSLKIIAEIKKDLKNE